MSGNLMFERVQEQNHPAAGRLRRGNQRIDKTSKYIVIAIYVLVFVVLGICIAITN